MENKKTNKKEGLSTGESIGIGATVAVLAAAGYLLFGPEGKKNRKTIKGWAVKMKGEIIERFEGAKELTEPVYHKIIDSVAAKYSKLKNIDKAELDEIVKDARKHWVALSKGSKKTKINPRSGKKTIVSKKKS